MRAFIAMSAVLGLLLVAASAQAADAPKNLAVEDLPDAVVDAAKAKFPKGNITSAVQKEESGQKVYELKIKTGDKEEMVKVNPKGEVIGSPSTATAQGPTSDIQTQSQQTGRRGILGRLRARRLARRGN
jgi:hypothetical protein